MRVTDNYEILLNRALLDFKILSPVIQSHMCTYLILFKFRITEIMLRLRYRIEV